MIESTPPAIDLFQLLRTPLLLFPFPSREVLLPYWPKVGRLITPVPSIVSSPIPSAAFAASAASSFPSREFATPPSEQRGQVF